ncbi:MAG: TraR/DksA family transcriptional regulator [Alphaproteobacteria bacterium]|nr:MAG: TraR/DksA family transcriptional regulator [Alphaproteobacteria bacterium]
MDKATLARFRARLLDELAALGDDLAQAEADAAPVELDQQAVGRLSRMDAMQRQAMAAATRRRRAAAAERIRAALMRIDEGEYGYCEICGEEIGLGRLEIAPAATRCVGCARG